MKVSAILIGKKDQLGRQRVYLRTNQGKKRTYKATELKATPKEFDKEPLKSKLRKLILDYEDRLTSDLPKDIRFSQYLINCLNSWDHKQYATLKQIKTEGERFATFSRDPYMSKVTPELLTKYRQFRKGSPNTIWKSFKVLKTIFHQGVKDRVIISNPFDRFQSPKYKDPPKSYLIRQQIEKIENTVLPPEFEIARTWFVIGCYTGLRFGDMIKFSKNNVRNGRLIIYTSKTGELVSMPLNEKLKGLFDKIGYYPLSYSNQHYNKVLKSIGALCEIKEPLTAHLSRHTFATLCADSGISQEVTAKLLGHSSLRTTAVYYRITGVRIDSEFSKLF